MHRTTTRFAPSPAPSLILLLQDLCPLLSIEWAYQWKLFNTLNSAAMRLFPSGRNVNDILRMMGAQYPW